MIWKEGHVVSVMKRVIPMQVGIKGIEHVECSYWLFLKSTFQMK